ncbi:MAG: hypothetical protein E7324_02605 [Clostridiales bacterium]|nr:hypothetical protein [Clostridiales bacterium]
MEMKFGLRRLLAAVCALLVMAGALPAAAESYTYTTGAQARPSAEIYQPVRVITGGATGAGEFDMPEDIFWLDGKLYVADTGNDRIVVLDENFQMIKELDTPIVDDDDDEFYSPTGLFVGERGMLVCDKNNKRLLLLNEDDEATIVYEKPDAKALAGTTFKPVKAVMDKDGNAYVLANGVYQGLLMFNPEGGFEGFFGANVIEATLSLIMERFWKSFFSKEASETMARSIPIEYSNIVMDGEDFIYASIFKTQSGSGNVKKLNALGKNILNHPRNGTALDPNRYGDLRGYTEKGAYKQTQLTDIAVDEDGVITVLDGTWGRLFQYSPDGDLLGTFGGKGDVKGMFSDPSAVVYTGKNYIVLDKVKGTLTEFAPTPYRELLGEALRYYTAGEYQASIDAWRQILKYDASMTLAYKSIGKAYMQQGKWQEALENLEIAGARNDYSLVLSNVRREFIRDNFVWLLLGVVAGCIALSYLYRGLRKWMGFSVKQKKRRRKA